MGAADRVFLLVQYDHGQRAAYLDPISPAFNAYTNVPWWQGQLSETHALGTAAANQFLLGGTYINQVTSVANPAQTQSAISHGAVVGQCRLGFLYPGRNGFSVCAAGRLANDDHTRYRTTW